MKDKLLAPALTGNAFETTETHWMILYHYNEITRLHKKHERNTGTHTFTPPADTQTITPQPKKKKKPNPDPELTPAIIDLTEPENYRPDDTPRNPTRSKNHQDTHNTSNTRPQLRLHSVVSMFLNTTLLLAFVAMQLFATLLLAGASAVLASVSTVPLPLVVKQLKS